MMSVYDIKTLNGKCICSVDGSRIDIDPLFHKNHMNIQYLLKIKGNRENRRLLQVVHV